MPVESAEDLTSFFETDDFAVEAAITNPADEDFDDFTIDVIFNAAGEAVAIYGETSVQAPEPSFICKTADLANVKRKYVATIASKAYVVERIEAMEDGATSTVYLSE